MQFLAHCVKGGKLLQKHIKIQIPQSLWRPTELKIPGGRP